MVPHPENIKWKELKIRKLKEMIKGLGCTDPEYVIRNTIKQIAVPLDIITLIGDCGDGDGDNNHLMIKYDPTSDINEIEGFLMALPDGIQQIRRQLKLSALINGLERHKKCLLYGRKLAVMGYWKANCPKRGNDVPLMLRQLVGVYLNRTRKIKSISSMLNFHFININHKNI